MTLSELVSLEHMGWNILFRFAIAVLMTAIGYAFYRFLPAGTDENANADMASLYNHIDRYAADLGCAFVLIHHSSKGNQSGKSVTDVGAGAGSHADAGGHPAAAMASVTRMLRAMPLLRRKHLTTEGGR